MGNEKNSNILIENIRNGMVSVEKQRKKIISHIV